MWHRYRPAGGDVQEGVWPSQLLNSAVAINSLDLSIYERDATIVPAVLGGSCSVEDAVAAVARATADAAATWLAGPDGLACLSTPGSECTSDGERRTRPHTWPTATPCTWH